MIGIVVVTHGALAGELVNAARTIVGDIPHIAAVSIGWSDDVSAAREAIARALEDVGGEQSLILTDMFGGTPTNVSLPFLSPRVEIVTGVNLPMLLKLSVLRGSGNSIVQLAHDLAEAGQRSIGHVSESLRRLG